MNPARIKKIEINRILETTIFLMGDPVLLATKKVILLFMGDFFF